MKILKKAYVWLVFLFLYAPIVLLMVYSFNENSNRSKFTGFSFRWYKELFSDSEIMSALYYTLLLAVVSAVIATVIGTITAIGIYNMRRGQKTFLMKLIDIPMLNPEIVTGVSLMLLYVMIGLNRGFTTLLISHIMFEIPYVVTSVLPKLGQLNPHLYEAALDLGSSPFHAYRKVILPEIMPGIITGFLFAITLSIDDFVISFFTAGNGVQNLSILIYSAAKKGVKPTINALSTLMFVVVLLLLFIVNKRSRQPAKVKKEEI